MKSPRLLALDIDGTLLDSGGALRPRTIATVTEARRAGLQIVICTGRRFRTALPVVERLGLEGPVIVHNGAVVKDALSGTTRSHAYLPLEAFEAAHALLRTVTPPLVYVDGYHDGLDMVSEPPERVHPFQAEYLEDYLGVLELVDSLESRADHPIVMMSCMADAERLVPLHERVRSQVGAAVRTDLLENKSYRGHILEIRSVDATKWHALESIGQEMGIEPEEMVAIGDDTNDAEMIAGVGLGIAMGNAAQAVLDVADRVTASNDEDGAARAIEELIGI